MENEPSFSGKTIKCGEPATRFVEEGFATVQLKPGVLGLYVRIMPPNTVLPDSVEILPPKMTIVEDDVEVESEELTEEEIVEEEIIEEEEDLEELEEVEVVEEEAAEEAEDSEDEE